MSIARTLQFNNLEDLVEAYLNTDIPAFAIFEHTNQYHAYEGGSISEGEGEMRQMVGMLMKNRSAAIYTLKLYKGLKDGELITNKTQCVRSWNFRFYDFRGEEYGLPSPRGDDRYVNKLESENTALKLRIEELEQEVEDLEEAGKDSDQDTMGKVTKILENPAVLNMIGTVRSWFIKTPATAGQAGTMGGLNFSGDWRTDEKIDNAMRLLSERDPDLPEVMNKWAALAVHRPADYAMYKGMLLQLNLG
jgi:hypothetical protein